MLLPNHDLTLKCKPIFEVQIIFQDLYGEMYDWAFEELTLDQGQLEATPSET